MTENEKMDLMHEVLTHRYRAFYLAHPSKRELALRLHELGFFNDETGQATEVAQDFFDNLFKEYEVKLMNELRKNKRNADGLTYNQLSLKLGFPVDSLFLHHFLMKLHRSEEISYREIDDYNAKLKYLFDCKY